jgi:methionyl aminopeptidase
MIFTIEPMINMGKSDAVNVSMLDGWTVRTADGSPSAQFEHTVLVMSNGAEILTKI